MASEALKREQLVTKLHLLDNRVKDGEINMKEVQSGSELAKEKIGELER